jgi:hypothetical protein
LKFPDNDKISRILRKFYKGKILPEHKKMKKPTPLTSISKKVRFVEDKGAKSSTEKGPESRLGMIFDAMGRNGSSHRTITSNKPIITNKVVNPKKGRGESVVTDFFYDKQKSDEGKEILKKKDVNYDYSFSDDLTAKFIRLVEISEKAGSRLYDVTVLFNLKANAELREVDGNPDTVSMIRKVYNWIYESKLIKDAIIVVEECKNSKVSIKEIGIDGEISKMLPRLHVHILTHLNEDEVANVRKLLLKDQRTRLQAKDYWDNKVLFNEFHEVEEEEFGKAPANQPEPYNEHWTNQFTKRELGRKYLCTRLPISLDGADYLVKQFGIPFCKGRHDAYLGLEGYPEIRKRLYEQSKGINKALLPKKESLKKAM